MAPTPKRERHLDLWSSIFQAIWPEPPIISVVGRSPAASRVFLPSVYFLNGRNNKRSQPPPRRTGRAFGYLHSRNITCRSSGTFARAHACRVTTRHASSRIARGIRPSVTDRFPMKAKGGFGSLRGRLSDSFLLGANREMIIFPAISFVRSESDPKPPSFRDRAIAPSRLGFTEPADSVNSSRTMNRIYINANNAKGYSAVGCRKRLECRRESAATGSIRVKVPTKPGRLCTPRRDLRARKGAFGDDASKKCQRPARGTPRNARDCALGGALFSASCLEAHSRAAH